MWTNPQETRHLPPISSLFFFSGTFNAGYGYGYGVGYSTHLPPAKEFRFTCHKKYGYSYYYKSVSLKNDYDYRFKYARIVWNKKYMDPGFKFSQKGKIYCCNLNFYLIIFIVKFPFSPFSVNLDLSELLLYFILFS